MSPASPVATAATPARTAFALGNAVRGEQGLAALRWHSALEQAAVWHVLDMATFRYFAHTGRDGHGVRTRAMRAGYVAEGRGYVLAENLALGHADARAVVEGWLRSPGHCANLLSATVDETGLAWARDDQGRPYWVQVFGRRLD